MHDSQKLIQESSKQTHRLDVSLVILHYLGMSWKSFFLNMVQRTMVYNLSKQIAKIQVSTLSSTQYMEIFEPGDIALLYLGPHWGPTYFGSTVSNYPWLQKSKSSATPHFYGGVLCELATTAIGVYCQPIGFHSRLGSDWLLGTSTLGMYVTMVRGGCHSSLLPFNARRTTQWLPLFVFWSTLKTF